MNLSAIAEGLKTQYRLFDITANNVANVNTAGFKQSWGVVADTAAGGARLAEVHTDPSPGPLFFTGNETDSCTAPDGTVHFGVLEGSNTDLVGQTVDSIMQHRTIEALAAYTRTAAEMSSTAVNLLA